MLSVIIPTRNRADFLATALSSIEQQNLSKEHFEVLVIDNGSTDHTQKIVDKAASWLPNLRYFLESEPGLHAGRHRGLREAQSDILVYADDDIHAIPSWLSTLDDIFTDPKVAMAGGNNYPDFLGPVPSWLEKLWAKPVEGGQILGQLSIISLPAGRREISPLWIWGCNFSVRKQVLLDAGGFHPDSMPQDLIQFRGDGETHVSRFAQDNGLTCIFDSKASVHHAVTPERMTFDYFRRRAFNQGVSDSYTSLRNSAEQRQGFAKLQTLTRKILGRVKQFVRSHQEQIELRELAEISRQGYWEGFEFHQQRYRSEKKVRDWVHRAQYF